MFAIVKARRKCSLPRETAVSWSVELSELYWVNCRLISGGTWSFPLGRLCAGLLTQQPDKEGAPWHGRKEGKTPPLGMSLTEMYRGMCYFPWEEGMWPGLCRMCYHLIDLRIYLKANPYLFCCTTVWIISLYLETNPVDIWLFLLFPGVSVFNIIWKFSHNLMDWKIQIFY